MRNFNLLQASNAALFTNSYSARNIYLGQHKRRMKRFLRHMLTCEIHVLQKESMLCLYLFAYPLN